MTEEKLKTLKDMEILNQEDYDVPTNAIEIIKLRQEAIKWIKERINICTKCSCLGDWSQLIACEEHKFWMERFNIKKEDLK